MTRDPDVVVIGSGPNGLVAAGVLAARGHRVLVLEANPDRPGGALGSRQLTRPGFVHDLGAAFFPFAHSSPAFRHLGVSIDWLNATHESCHPARDGSYACLTRDPEQLAAHFGSPRDGATMARLQRWHAAIEDRLMPALLGPFPQVWPVLRVGLLDLAQLGWLLTRSAGGLGRHLFRSTAARRVFAALAMHVDVAPGDLFGAPIGYLLGMGASTGGFCVPRGGAQALANELVTILERHGGRLHLGARVTRVLHGGGRAIGVALADGSEVTARRAVLADTAAPRLLLDLVDRAAVPRSLVRKMESFRQGWSTFKVDWALNRPVPWEVEAARQSAVVHTGEDLDDLQHVANQVRAGTIPTRPYLVIGQQSLVDPDRAPRNQHTLYAYGRVPTLPRGEWAHHAEGHADAMEARIEELAPGFRGTILARAITTPDDLERSNDNLIGGDLGGGSAQWHRQLIFKPAFPYFRYRMPLPGLYLCSSYAHPGTGVHGMCGYNAALIAARDIE